MAATNELYDVKEALNEYFKLKLKYEKKIQNNKKDIINQETLSNREKRSNYLKLKPKCINCGRPGGTKFENTYFPSDDKDSSHRQYSATCGIIADPCGLNIKIKVGNVDLLPGLLDEIQTSIKMLKDEVIDDKNKLLFGYLSTEDVLNKFDDLKEHINVYTSLYEQYLEKYNELVDNPQKKSELDESITESFYKIDEIKECIKKMNETNNVQYATDAVSIYTTTLQPLLRKIQTLKYNENVVWNNPYTKTCNLMQNRYSIENLSYTSYNDNVISFEKGLKTSKKDKNKKGENNKEKIGNQANKFIIDENSSEESHYDNEPIYKNDDITWSNPEYTNLWKEMPSRLKNALRTNPEWMKDFMANCVTARKNKKPCTITAPKDLIVPPELMPNGEYNFGVKIYNDAFNKLPKQTQETYFTFNNGIDDWSKFVAAMNDLVTNELGDSFNKGYF